ncbi:MAG: PadR family transcriptional regulator [Acidimicrobiia bacterium]
MSTPSPATYGLLGQLAVRPWTGYELTQQLRRSLRFVWPTSEGHLYREQKKLVELGWATAVDEPVGNRTRKRYEITDEGRAALADWLATEPEEPHFEIEGVLRLFNADHGDLDDVVASLEASATKARAMLDELLGFVDDYLADDGPLALLEAGEGGPGDRREFRGRPVFPERLHVVSMVIDVTTSLLAELESFSAAAAEDLGNRTSATDPSLTADTRRRLEAIRDRHRQFA